MQSYIFEANIEKMKPTNNTITPSIVLKSEQNNIWVQMKHFFGHSCGLGTAVAPGDPFQRGVEEVMNATPFLSKENRQHKTYVYRFCSMYMWCFFVGFLFLMLVLCFFVFDMHI